MLPVNRRRQLDQLSRLAPVEYNQIIQSMRCYPHLDHGRRIAKAMVRTQEMLSMSFPTFKQEHREPIFCWLYGVARGGKTTLALDFIRANQPGVVIPMDQRFEVYRDLALAENVQAWPVSDPSDPTLWASADHILENLRRNFPGSGAKSLVWDSVTPGFRHWVEWAQSYADMTAKEREAALGAKYKNKSALYQPKAHYMEQAAMIANYGVACLWISHEHEGRDEQGKEKTKTSVTDQERLKFQRNVNLTLKIRWQGKRYGVEIEDARNRPSLNGQLIWDEPGNMFRGMWRQIAEAFYAAEVVDWDRLEIFASDRQAADLALAQSREVNGEVVGAFKNVNHALNAFNQVKKQIGGDDPRALARAWKTEVATRLQAAVDDYLEKLKGEIFPAESDEPPVFKTIDDLLYRLHQDFGLGETEAKARLKTLGHKSFSQAKSGQMYADVKAAMTQQEFEF